MLTKDLINFRKRKEKVYPGFIDIADRNLLQVAEDLLHLYRGGIGQTRESLSEEISAIVNCFRKIKVAKGMNKLCEDRSEFSLPGEFDYAAARESIFDASAKILACTDPIEREALHAAVLEILPAEIQPLLEGDIYGDLPANETLESFRDLNAHQLLQRYNVSQAQFLLLSATEIEIEVTAPESADLRRLMKYLRFFRLMHEIEITKGDCKKPKSLKMIINGPASVLENTRKYGMQLANFFPALPALKKWKLQAQVKIDKTLLTLELDQRSGLVSPYKNFHAYTPEEVKVFAADFKQRSETWKIAEEPPFVQIGPQEIIFPDFTFTAPGKKLKHLELFHRWHAAQLPKRLQQLRESAPENLILGVDRHIAKQTGLDKELPHDKFLQQRVFLFSDFPSLRALLKLLDGN